MGEERMYVWLLRQLSYLMRSYLSNEQRHVKRIASVEQSRRYNLGYADEQLKMSPFLVHDRQRWH